MAVGVQIETPHEANQSACLLATTCNFAFACGCGNLQSSYHSEVLPHDSLLFRTEADKSYVYVIKSGLVVVYVVTANGDRVAYGIYGSNQAIGTNEVFSTMQPQNIVMTFSQSEICKISAKRIRRLIVQNPAHLKNLYNASTGNIVALCYQLWVMNGAEVHNRIKRLLYVIRLLEGFSEEERFELPVSHESVALLAKSNRPTATRALHRLAEEGFIELKYKDIVVKPAKSLPLEDADSFPTEFLPSSVGSAVTASTMRND